MKSPLILLILNILNKNKYNIIPIFITKEGEWLKNNKECDIKNENIDLAIPILHGAFGEDGRLQGMLEMLGIPYLFSGVMASAIGMNKVKSKIIAENAELGIVPYLVLGRNDKINIQEIIDQLSLPIVVKPIEQGSSVGISIAKTENELKKGIKKAFKYDVSVMLEKYKKGRELTVGILEKERVEALPVVEIIPQLSEFYDYDSKYKQGGSKHICPAEIPDEIKDKIQNDAVKAFKAIGCKDLARVDFIWSEEDNKVYFIEINTIPGMTSVSLFPEAVKVAGMKLSEVFDELIENNLK